MKNSHLKYDRSKLVHAPYQAAYIERVPTDELLNEMEIQLNHARHFYSAISSERLDFRYALGKWTLREIVQHVMDWERIFTSRALIIARGMKSPHSGYDPDELNANTYANDRPLDELLIEWAHIRRSTIGLFQTFDEQILVQEAEVGGSPQNVMAIGYMIVGHEMHHRHIYAERYLNEPLNN